MTRTEWLSLLKRVRRVLVKRNGFRIPYANGRQLINWANRIESEYAQSRRLWNFHRISLYDHAKLFSPRWHRGMYVIECAGTLALAKSGNLHVLEKLIK